MNTDISETTTSLLERILQDVHPLMAEALYLAAVPHWFNADLFAAIRQQEDGRNAGLIERLLRYSFISPLSGTDEESPVYTVRPDERRFLQRYWIARDREAYLAAHRRALAYWQEQTNADDAMQVRNQLYHWLFVDLDAGINFLITQFRVYYKVRHLTAIERLLDTVAEARFYLVMLGADLTLLDDLRQHMGARLAQFRGHWAESLEVLEELRFKPTLSLALFPYVVRAYGESLAQAGRFVDAIEEHELALAQFDAELERQTAESGVKATGVVTAVTDAHQLQLERAYTQLALGDAYVGLAESTRGYQETVVESPSQLERLRDLFNFFISLPLLLYLSLFLGWQVWHPRFWPILQHLDWIVARLFATGAVYYRRADKLLESHGQPVEAVAADEKLAHLMLALLDAQGAEQLFRRLLAEEDAPLSGYQRLSVHVGLARALLLSGQAEAAQQYLEEALPQLAEYKAVPLQAEAHELLAEALLARQDAAEAIVQFDVALDLYQAQANHVRMTEIADRLEVLTRDEQVEGVQQEAAKRVATAVSEYHYPVRYRHPATVVLQQTTLIFLALVIFLIPIYTISLDTSSTLSPSISFRGREFVLWPALIIEELDQQNEAAILEEAAPTAGNTAAPILFRPAIADAGLTVNAVPATDSEVALQIGVLLFVLYLVFSTAVGVAAIFWTPLRSIQRVGSGRLVRLDEEGVHRAGKTIPWPGVTRRVRADVRMINELLPDQSALVLASPQRQITIPGNTVRYEAVRRRLETFLPPQTPQDDLSYRLLRSPMGVWYVLSIALLTLLGLAGRLFPQVLNFDFPGTVYSLADVYPYLYLGVFIPPLWAFVWRPLRVQRIVHPASRLAWIVGGLGLILLVLRLGSLFFPWLTMPDIYPSLGILILIVGATIVFWRARRIEDGRPVYPLPLRAAALVVALLTLFVMGSHLVKEVSSYHYLIVGNSLRDQSLQADEETAAVLADEAVAAYSRAINIAQTRIFGVTNTQVAVTLLAPILRPTQSVWFQALRNRAAIYMQLGNFRSALADYDALVTVVNVPDVVASRTIAQLGLSTQTGSEPDYQSILKELGRIIGQNPQNAYYRLWRGVTYHIQGDAEAAFMNYEEALAIEGARRLDPGSRSQALTGEGWLRYSQNEYVEAVTLFQEAIDANPQSAEAYLGLGFSYYQLREYDEAEEAWEKTAELIPNDPLIYISLGTLYWRLGMLGPEQSVLVRNRCADDNLTEAQKQASAAFLEQSIDYFQQAVALPGREAGDVAETYRTLAQIQFLLRHCPGYDSVEVLKATIDSYTEAIVLAPDMALYWHMRGRLAYALWRELPAGTGPSARVWLFDALDDTETALALNPEDIGDYQPNRYYDLISDNAIEGTLTQGNLWLAEGDYEVALGYYELLAERVPTHVESAFRAGLASVALNDVAQALDWYWEGITRAQAADNAAAVLLARSALTQWIEQNGGPNVGDILRLLDDSGLVLDPAELESAATAFDLSLLFLSEGNQALFAAFANQGMELAAEAEDIGVVKSAAAALAGYLINHPETEATAVYWPLFDELAARQTAVADLEHPDLYWRYRAEYGFRLVLPLFKERNGREDVYARIYDSIQADIEQAYRLDADAHEVWRDFFVDAGIGWHYLRRGDDAYAQAEYELALADYETATEIIQPDSENALNDLTEATFKAGLTSLRLGETRTAALWYAAGLDLVQQYEGNEGKLIQARAALSDLLEEEPNLAPAIESLLAALGNG